jgi:hypothetical protein
MEFHQQSALLIIIIIVIIIIIITILLTYGTGMEPSPLLLKPLIGLLYHPWMIGADDCGAISGMNEWQRKPKYSEEICPSAAVSTTDRT